jgi:Fic family protein
MAKPPFSVTPRILALCTGIARILGTYEGLKISRPQPRLRKSNRVRTIQGSLAIEGNTLNLNQVTAILDGKRVLGSKKEIIEVQNAINAYDAVSRFKPYRPASLLKAHGILMRDLIPDAGKWRNKNVGIFHGEKIHHTAPQARHVPELMDRLFNFIQSDSETHPLVLSAIFHYELEFIHPFSDGNGRIGRLWQTVLLTRFHPIFEFVPIESVIRERQQDYYDSLGRSDKEANAAPFIEFSLSTIQAALHSMVEQIRPEPLTAEARLQIARDTFKKKEFSRKDYLGVFKTISTATASRDLAFGVKKKILGKIGDRRLTYYKFTS